MISVERDLPYDRPNLSKDFLAGIAPEESIALRSRKFYADHDIQVVTSKRAWRIDTTRQIVALSNGDSHPFSRLLIATGASPIGLDVPGAGLPHVHYLRSFDDCRRIVRAAGDARHVVVVGASFIGLEVAASMRMRRLSVDVVGGEHVPMQRVLGSEVGAMLRRVHEAEGTVFHMRRAVKSIDTHGVTLDNGEVLQADLVIVGIGVRPNSEIAADAGLSTDRGVLVNRFLETSVQGIFAAGDVARWPDPRTGVPIRVEHWALAQQQGQVAARNMLADERVLFEAFREIPFFWSQHFDLIIRYSGHADSFDEVIVDGDIGAFDATISYRLRGHTLAVATIGRDHANLRAELSIERTTGWAGRRNSVLAKLPEVEFAI